MQRTRNRMVAALHNRRRIGGPIRLLADIPSHSLRTGRLSRKAQLDWPMADPQFQLEWEPASSGEG